MSDAPAPDYDPLLQLKSGVNAYYRDGGLSKHHLDRIEDLIESAQEHVAYWKAEAERLQNELKGEQANNDATLYRIAQAVFLLDKVDKGRLVTEEIIKQIKYLWRNQSGRGNQK